MQYLIFDFRSRAFVILVLAFVFLTFLVYFGVTEAFDQGAIEYVQSIIGNPVLDIFMQSVTEAGDVFYMLGFSIVLLIIRKTRRLGLALMILLVLATLLTGYIKCGVDRDRPEPDFEGAIFPIEISSDTFALFCE